MLTTNKIPLGAVMCDLRGLVLEDDEKEMLMHPNVGGVILFTRNYESPLQLMELTASIHALRSPHLLIGVDQEGGRVQRFKHGLSQLPSARQIGMLADREALSVCEQAGWLMAAELLAIGVDLSFAPVLDTGSEASTVIGDRAFHASPKQISVLASAFVAGMNRAGMAAVGKHFPGHGSVAEDSHITIPYDCRHFDSIRLHDLVPFQTMIQNGILGIMSAHVIYPNIDKKPAGFSDVWLTKILREQMGFTGAIFSDDLSMAGAQVIGSYRQRVEVAIQAGCDMVLVCNNQAAVTSILAYANMNNRIESQARLIRMRGEPRASLDRLRQTRLWQRCHATLSHINQLR